MNISLPIQKNYVAWFQNNEDSFKLGSFPCFLVEYEEDKQLYGFPNVFGTGVKIGLHQEGPSFNEAN